MLGPAPAPVRCGLAAHDVAELAREVLTAWDGFLSVVRDPSTDLGRPSRLTGWTGRQACIHLGSWDDSRVLDAVLTSARTGDLTQGPPPDAGNDALVRAHAGAGDDEVVAALVRARERLATFFSSGEADEVGRLLSRSTVGPLPVLSLVHAGTYELAVHALDLRPCGAPHPPAQLLDRGLASLLDVTGSLAARSGVDVLLTAATPDGGWRFASDDAGWTTERWASPHVEGAGVSATVTDLLDASAGRVSVPQLLLTRRMAVSELPQWMRLAPLVEQVPGLPGGAALRAAVGGVTGLAGGVGRALSRFRR